MKLPEETTCLYTCSCAKPTDVPQANSLKTYMSFTVHGIVRELEFGEGNRLPCPVCTRGGAVGVNVKTVSEGGLGFARHQPLAVMVAIAVAVTRLHVQQEKVARCRL